MDMRKVVGHNVRHHRRKRALTQEAVAGMVGTSQKYLSDLECGKNNPTINTLSKIAKALGVSYLDLLRLL